MSRESDKLGEKKTKKGRAYTNTKMDESSSADNTQNLTFSCCFSAPSLPVVYVCLLFRADWSGLIWIGFDLIDWIWLGLVWFVAGWSVSGLVSADLDRSGLFLVWYDRVLFDLAWLGLAWLGDKGRPRGCDQGGVHDRRQDGRGQGALQVPGKENRHRLKLGYASLSLRCKLGRALLPPFYK